VNFESACCFLILIFMASFSPLDLLQNEESAFYKMCRNSGEFDTLLELAKAKHQLVDIS